MRGEIKMFNNDELIDLIAFRDIKKQKYSDEVKNELYRKYSDQSEINNITGGFENPLVVSNILLIRSSFLNK